MRNFSSTTPPSCFGAIAAVPRFPISDIKERNRELLPTNWMLHRTEILSHKLFKLFLRFDLWPRSTRCNNNILEGCRFREFAHEKCSFRHDLRIFNVDISNLRNVRSKRKSVPTVFVVKIVWIDQGRH
jgi:hypothetical protein